MTKRDWPETLDITNWEEAIRGHPDHERYHKEHRADVDAVTNHGGSPLPVGAALLYLRIIMGHPEFSWFCQQGPRTKEAYKRTSDVAEVLAITEQRIPGYREASRRITAFEDWFILKLRINRYSMNGMLHCVAEWMLRNRVEPSAATLRQAWKQVAPDSHVDTSIDFSR